MHTILSKSWFRIVFVILLGLIPAFASQFIINEPTTHNIHVKSFRYGKDPSVIRCNRGDSLLLTFSSDDTGHSFFLEEFDMDVKVNPATSQVSVFKTSDPTQTPHLTDTVKIKAEHKGFWNYLISKSNFRCHVWCGPMHAFEQGKLVIFPNTLLLFSSGCLFGMMLLWLSSFWVEKKDIKSRKVSVDLLDKFPLLQMLLKKRLPQVVAILFALALMYLVIVTTLFGTKVSGRNFGVMMMWAVWLFILVAILTPFLGRAWCTICPMPFFGEWYQRGSLFTPETGRTKKYYNVFSGLFLKWPKRLRNSWPRLVFFMILSTFSTTLVAMPWVSGVAVLLLIITPTILSFIFEHRAFCRYLCPVSVFVSPFSGLSPVVIQSKSEEVCDKCKGKFCEKGSKTGWACPYGLNIGKLENNSECGMCLECLRSCTYNNVSVFKRAFGKNVNIKSISEAWVAIAIFSMSIIYSIVYLGTWPELRDYINILDKQNWDLFGIYSIVVWSLVLIVIPTLIYLMSAGARKTSRISTSSKSIFYNYCASLIPMGMTLWIAFVIPMLFVNVTFVAQSLSDPFGWGWDFFGTAGIPWHQFIPEFIPFMQAGLVLFGLNLSLKRLKENSIVENISNKARLTLALPMGLFLLAVAIFMILFFTN